MGRRRPLSRFILGLLILIWIASAVLLCQNPDSLLFTVAHNICHPSKKEEELVHLSQVFQANGFPKQLVQKILVAPPSVSSTPSVTEENLRVLCTPYVKGLSERIEKICTPLGVRPVFKPARTLRQILTKVKTRIPQEKQTGVVYEIPCSDCREVYVGETKRPLKVRMGEHRQATCRGDQKNGIAVHVQKTDHHINWEGATVKRRESGFWQRRMAEAIQIRMRSPNMNLDKGLLLPMVWNSILDTHPT